MKSYDIVHQRHYKDWLKASPVKLVRMMTRSGRWGISGLRLTNVFLY